MTGVRAPRFDLDSLGQFLIAPDAGERLSPATTDDAGRRATSRGAGALVIDLRGPDGEAIDRWAGSLARTLPSLPCVTVGLIDEAELPSCEDLNTLARACDVVVETDAALEGLLSGFTSTPVAALAFVQLLRNGSQLSIRQGLVAESFVYSTLQAGREFREWLSDRRGKRSSRSGEDEAAACRMDRDRGRLDIRLTRPAKHNAFSRAMRDGMCEALQLALADPTIEVVRLSGEGKSFCSGGDLDEFGSFPDPAESHVIRTTRSPAWLLSGLSDRAEAFVHGACLGAGVELPSFTSRVVADESAYFGLPEVALGLVPGAGGTVSLPRRIGRQRTAWLGLSGERVDAQTALAWGLVDEVQLRQHPNSEA